MRRVHSLSFHVPLRMILYVKGTLTALHVALQRILYVKGTLISSSCVFAKDLYVKGTLTCSSCAFAKNLVYEGYTHRLFMCLCEGSCMWRVHSPALYVPLRRILNVKGTLTCSSRACPYHTLSPPPHFRNGGRNNRIVMKKTHAVHELTRVRVNSWREKARPRMKLCCMMRNTEVP